MSEDGEVNQELRTVRTFLVCDVVCSLCGTNEHMYEVFARTTDLAGTVDKIAEGRVCVHCDFGEV